MSVNTNPVLAPEYMCAAYAMEKGASNINEAIQQQAPGYTQLGAFLPND